jgi:hypothetical protein
MSNGADKSQAKSAAWHNYLKKRALCAIFRVLFELFPRSGVNTPDNFLRAQKTHPPQEVFGSIGQSVSDNASPIKFTLFLSGACNRIGNKSGKK